MVLSYSIGETRDKVCPGWLQERLGMYNDRAVRKSYTQRDDVKQDFGYALRDSS